MSRIVFILGAGASVDSGAPTMLNFLDKARDLLYEGRLESNDADRFEKVFNATGLLQRILAKSSVDIVNIESVFGLLEMARTISSFPGLTKDELGANNDVLDQLIQNLKFLITATLERTMEFPYRKKLSPPDSYGKLADLIFDLWRKDSGNSTSILTFNYDLGADFALAHKAIIPEYCLDDGDWPEIQDNKTLRVPLLKLHGSLNWKLDISSGEVQPVHINKLLGTRSIFEPSHEPDKSRLMVSSLIKKINEKDKNKYDLFIVPPTWSKSEHHGRIAPVWKAAAKELSEAEHIFIIGYSLPESDYFFKFLYALGTVSDQSLLRHFWVFNPDASAEQRYKGLLGPGAQQRFRFFPAYFRDSTDIIREALLEG